MQGGGRDRGGRRAKEGEREKRGVKERDRDGSKTFTINNHFECKITKFAN